MNAKNSKTNEERRKAKRTTIQEGFNLFLVIPKISGMTRVYMNDLSQTGLRFMLDGSTIVKENQQISVQLYLNSAIYLPLDCLALRVSKSEVAVKFLNPQSPAVQAIGKLQEFIESAEKAGKWAE